MALGLLGKRKIPAFTRVIVLAAWDREIAFQLKSLSLSHFLAQRRKFRIKLKREKFFSSWIPRRLWTHTHFFINPKNIPFLFPQFGKWGQRLLWSCVDGSSFEFCISRVEIAGIVLLSSLGYEVYRKNHKQLMFLLLFYFASF